MNLLLHVKLCPSNRYAKLKSLSSKCFPQNSSNTKAFHVSINMFSFFCYCYIQKNLNKDIGLKTYVNNNWNVLIKQSCNRTAELKNCAVVTSLDMETNVINVEPELKPLEQLVDFSKEEQREKVSNFCRSSRDSFFSAAKQTANKFSKKLYRKAMIWKIWAFHLSWSCFGEKCFRMQEIN